MKKLAALFLCVVCAAAMAGCSLLKKTYTYTAEENSLYIHSDGEITADIIEDFDKDYYDLNELTALAQQEIQNYNSAYGLNYYSADQMSKEEAKKYLLPVSLQSIKKESGKVYIEIKYANGEAYCGFNKEDLAKAGGTTVYTSIIGKSTRALDGTFVAAKGGAVQDLAQLSQKSDYFMVYVDYATKIYLEHEVEYVSSNVTVLSDNCVQTSAGTGSYIIFK